MISNKNLMSFLLANACGNYEDWHDYEAYRKKLQTLSEEDRKDSFYTGLVRKMITVCCNEYEVITRMDTPGKMDHNDNWTVLPSYTIFRIDRREYKGPSDNIGTYTPVPMIELGL